MVGPPSQCTRPAPWAPAILSNNLGCYACGVATSLWPCACVVWPKLSIKGAVFAPAVSQVLAAKPRGSTSDFLVDYAIPVTSCDSPPRRELYGAYCIYESPSGRASPRHGPPYGHRHPTRRNRRAQVPLHMSLGSQHFNTFFSARISFPIHQWRLHPSKYEIP